jgi:hypothetical protein
VHEGTAASGVIAVHNSNEREYAAGHDGMRRLATNVIRAPQYIEIRCIDTTTFARRTA